jgi:hypothetical protein
MTNSNELINPAAALSPANKPPASYHTIATELRYEIFRALWRIYFGSHNMAPGCVGSNVRMHIYSRGQNSLQLIHCPCPRDPAAPEREDPVQYILRKTGEKPFKWMNLEQSESIALRPNWGRRH